VPRRAQACDKFGNGIQEAVSAVQARSGQRTHAASGSFDIRVLAFTGPPARTLRGLQQIFGVDAATAQRIVDSAPGIVRRAAPAQEAHSTVAALQSLGAQVVLEASGAAAPLARGAGRPLPPAAAEDPDAWPELENVLNDPDVPRPARPPSADLEFDMLAAEDVIAVAPLRAAEPESFEASLDGMEPSSAEPELHGTPAKLLRTMRREELELDTSRVSALDVDLAAPARRHPALASAEARATRTQTAGLVKPALDAGQNAAPPGRATGKAAVLRHPPKPEKKSKALPLLSLLAAAGVGVSGVLLDNSIFYGNANLFSVLAHGLALQQLGYGLWGMTR
jgi:ribosomal protein L7/L12